MHLSDTFRNGQMTLTPAVFGFIEGGKENDG